MPAGTAKISHPQLSVSLVRRRLLRNLARSRLVWIILLASLLLSGCVQYDVGVNFDNPHSGEIVQQIKLGERLMSFSGDSAQEWLNSIERRTQQLQGKTKRSSQEITVAIPFTNGAELEEKFNKFFSPTSKKDDITSTAVELPNISSHLSLTQNNLLFLLRNRLSYDLDLRALSLISTKGNLLVGSDEILELKFSLNTPWGARSIESNQNAILPDKIGRQLVWTLKPSQLNHLEAVFWLPSPIGIGAVVIALLVAVGIYLRYNFMPAPTTTQPKVTAAL